ncbi:hypothetical protein Bpla01_05700 [Burkholderia plantarii]|nr:hypothetical protein Bpla01_05700 [Burkholderia plantarii]
MYWPLAIVVPLAAAAYLHASAAARPSEPLAIRQASAELARTVSFGLVGESPDAASATPIVATKAL